MASTAIGPSAGMLVHQPVGPVISSHQFSVEFLDSDDLATFVAAAVWADLVGRFRLEARGAQALTRGLKSVVGTTLVAARPRDFMFWIRHHQSPVRESTLAGATGEIRKGPPSRINFGLATAVINLVQIRSTARAQPGATRLTQDPHWHGEQDLFGRELGEIKLLTV
jgi:hypothetical protein